MAFRRSFHSEEKRSLLGVGSTVIALHLAGWGTLAWHVLPGLTPAGGGAAVLLGLAVSAYLLGIRHAFDADHIAAIDNATRRLVAAGRRPVSVGFWFALGHSTVVVASVVLLLLGIDAFSAGLANEGSSLRHVTGTWGGAVSGSFLLLTAALNLSSLAGQRRLLGRFHSSGTDAELHTIHDRLLDDRGLLTKVLRPVTRLVDRPWKMYPTGFLFGLGLDTAASIGLFVAGALTPGIPRAAVLLLPLLFAAGMTLFDSADGIFMNRVYGMAAGNPRRKVLYNLVVTAASVLVAIIIGGTGLLSAAAELFGLGGPLAALSAIDLNFLGVTLTVFVAFVWLAASRKRSGERKEQLLEALTVEFAVLRSEALLQAGGNNGEAGPVHSL